MLAANQPFMQYRMGKDLHASIGTSFSARSTMSEHLSTRGAAPNARDARVFFSFSCDEDRPRAQVIYKRWGERHPDGVPGFLDSTISQQARASGEEDVKQALSKVTLGEVDAALVYRTDVKAASDKVDGIEFPESAQAINTYPIVLLKGGQNKTGGQAFIDYVLSDAGKAVLTAAGFQAP